MPKTKPLKPYTKGGLVEAYKSVKQGNSIRKSAYLRGIPESTLRRYVHENIDPENVKPKNTYFTNAQEQQLASHCVYMANLGYPYARWQVMELAGDMIKVLGKSNLLAEKGDHLDAPSRNWFYGFLRRNDGVAMVNASGVEKARVDSSSRETMELYFQELDKLLVKTQLKNKPSKIYNIDETGISCDHSPPKVLVQKGKKGSSVTSGKSATTTVIAAGNASGNKIPPYIIFKGKRIYEELVQGGLPDTKFQVSANGWSTTDIFEDYFVNHFLTFVTPPAIALYDGHKTHISLNVIEKARDKGVHIFVIPAHTSHVSQPLDVAVFSPFKKSFSTECHKFLHQHPKQRITRYNLTSLISTAYNRALTSSNFISAFKKTGICPFNPDKVISSLPDKSSVHVEKSCRPTTRGERYQHKNVQELLSIVAQRFQPIAESAQKKRPYLIPKSGAAITEDEFYKVMKEDQSGSSSDSDASEEDSTEDEVDDEVCIVCGRRDPVLLIGGDAGVTWGQCDSCDGWVHLEFCTTIRHLEPEDTFNCPDCLHNAVVAEQ